MARIPSNAHARREKPLGEHAALIARPRRPVGALPVRDLEARGKVRKLHEDHVPIEPDVQPIRRVGERFRSTHLRSLLDAIRLGHCITPTAA
jgi:hypothetical protein